MDKPSTRIITGSFKGKRVMLPDDASVRPTRERVRMAVFNMLGSRLDWHGLRVVDACCGSGAWGLEALSRGAAEVWLVDRDVRGVQANVAALGLVGDTRVKVVQADVVGWVPSGPFDVLLVDPPYGKGLVQELLDRSSAWAMDGAWWCVETGVNDTLVWPETFTGLTEKAYGVSRVSVGRFFLSAKG